MKKFIETALFATIFGFFAFAAFFVFTELFSAQNPKFIDNFQGAFVGAFFAFLFLRFADGLSRIYERHAKNNKALILLEHHLNDCGGIIHDNIYILDRFLVLIEELEKDSSLPLVYSNILHPIPINKEIPVDLINIDSINELASYNLRTRKMNDSMQNLNNSYQQIKTSFVERHINPQTYVANVVGLKEDTLILRDFLSQLQKETVNVLATSRILCRDRTFFSRIVLLTFKQRYSKAYKENITTEINILKKEIDQVAKESKDRIDKIIGKTE
nr:hypothetical protein [uncultured Desulfuromonas sp.]